MSSAWVDRLSSTTWTSRCSGTERSIRFKNRRTFSARWRAVMSVISPRAPSPRRRTVLAAVSALYDEMGQEDDAVDTG
jgi:hypothetical protein